MNNIIFEMEKSAKENNVPIIEKDSLLYIINIIKNNNIKSLLELGTAIGYSTINFALAKKDIHITSIERDINRFNKAIENVNKSNLNNKITLIKDDIFNVQLKDKFDLIFIDAAKSQNEKFLNMFKNNLNKNGIIIIDNMNFHGLVGKSNEIKNRNVRGLARKIENFIDYLNNQNEFNIEYVKTGDTLCILTERK